MSKESKIYWGVGILSALFMVGSFFTPHEANRVDDLPWHIEHPAPDLVRVFGLTLGVSSADEAEQHFKEHAEPSLFKAPDGKMIAEVFFEQVDMAGLRSKIVLTMDVPEAELKGMYERGLRMGATGSGKKITMTTEDIAYMRTRPISSMSYLPSSYVEDAVFLKRFGQPAQRIKESESGLIHWLYPQNGLDITIGAGQKPLLQYVSPKDFDKLVQPLLASGEVLK